MCACSLFVPKGIVVSWSVGQIADLLDNGFPAVVISGDRFSDVMSDALRPAMLVGIYSEIERYQGIGRISMQERGHSQTR